ncbi:hypothetical protein [Nocardioides currus]|uniref:Uncharacterized protein n=1 Tax=Nocardioides currus TaxID=2133958 RepID=A0A2R7Z3G5_9ACTN|nr:hypothetical protein [Nocardioides currus]PUA82709.1 hypothetical protein C7S10_03020 [Nocardioides currus]
MLTDDDLTRQLRAAFTDDTADLAYDRAAPRVRTRPLWARPGVVALPAVGAVAAAVVVLGSPGDPTPPERPSASSAAPSTLSTPTRGAVVTEEITLAGMTFTYERGAGDESIDDQFLRVYDPGRLPAWAAPVELESGAAAKVWVGQDPANGSVSMFVDSPARWEGRLTGLASPTLTVEQMTSIATTGVMS